MLPERARARLLRSGRLLVGSVALLTALGANAARADIVMDPGASVTDIVPAPPPPPAKPKASAPAASALPPGHPAVGTPPASSAGELPPGHPPTGALPPGHPDTGAAPSGAMPPGHPGGAGAMPPGHPGGAGGPGAGDQPPEDDILDIASMPPGSIEVEIRDADDRPVPNAPVGLNILHNSVATGEQRERLTQTTDDRGVTRFENLKIGAAHSYSVSSVRGPSRFEADPFNLPEKGGRKVILHVYETVTNLDDAEVGIRALAFMSLKEDAIQVEQMLEVFNLGRTAWQAEVPVTLPAGFRAFNKSEEGGIANVDAAPDGYVLRGTFKPGRTPIGFRYQVPLSNDESQTLNVALPPRVAQARVITEASKQMELSVDGASPARRSRNRDGQAVLVTERAAKPGERGLDALAVTLRGLPTKGPGRFIAVGLATMMLIAGAVYIGGRRDKALDPDTRDDLVEAREALLRELVALERAHLKGDVGPKTYQRVRGAMLDALAHVVTQLEQAGVPTPTGAVANARAAVAPEASADAAPAVKPRKKRRAARPDGKGPTAPEAP